jgi:uncharacterized protein (UPF0548 family)
VFSLQRPSARRIDAFLRESAALPLSYSPVGIASAPPAAYDADETVAIIGRGDRCFERAKGALAGWKQFDPGWGMLFPATPPVDCGTTVTVLLRHLSFWSLNGCRVVYGIGDRTTAPRFGYAYGTLTNHAEIGEEIFEVEIDGAGDVRYRIKAASRPRAALARLGYPIVRVLQAKFRTDSVRVMTAAAKG